MIIDDTKNPATRPSAIESAIAHIERSLCPNGTGHEGIPEGERAGYEWRAIFRWAERESLVIPPQLAPERVGGREHDLTFLPLERRWRKFYQTGRLRTHGGFFRWMSVIAARNSLAISQAPATPEQLLGR